MSRPLSCASVVPTKGWHADPRQRLGALRFPPCRGRLLGDVFSLRRRELRRPRLATLEPPQPPEGHGRRVLAAGVRRGLGIGLGLLPRDLPEDAERRLVGILPLS